jgi:hypothetical protein
MTAHCESCAYYDEHHSNSGKATMAAEGLCRFNPPVSQPAPDAHGLWPVVSKEDWCGHYSHEAAAASHAA